MWTSDRSRKYQAGEPAADVGAVTLGEEPAGVYLDGERRFTQVYSPGGYSWRPAEGDQVLVLKAGGERESPCIIGRRQEGGLEPGEVSLSGAGGRASIRLRKNGTLALKGNLTVNGEPFEAYVKRIIFG